MTVTPGLQAEKGPSRHLMAETFQLEIPETELSGPFRVQDVHPTTTPFQSNNHLPLSKLTAHLTCAAHSAQQPPCVCGDPFSQKSHQILCPTAFWGKSCKLSLFFFCNLSRLLMPLNGADNSSHQCYGFLCLGTLAEQSRAAMPDWGGVGGEREKVQSEFVEGEFCQGQDACHHKPFHATL